MNLSLHVSFFHASNKIFYLTTVIHYVCLQSVQVVSTKRPANIYGKIACI